MRSLFYQYIVRILYCPVRLRFYLAVRSRLSCSIGFLALKWVDVGMGLPVFLSVLSKESRVVR